MMQLIAPCSFRLWLIWRATGRKAWQRSMTAEPRLPRERDDAEGSGRGRSDDGKRFVAGAVECKEGGRAGRIRLGLHPGLLAGRAEALPRRQCSGRFDDPHRRAVLPGKGGKQGFAKGGRRHGGARAVAVDPSCGRQPQAAGAHRLSRLPSRPLPGPSRRVRLLPEPRRARNSTRHWPEDRANGILEANRRRLSGEC